MRILAEIINLSRAIGDELKIRLKNIFNLEES